jgi:hypothetical protein
VLPMSLEDSVTYVPERFNPAPGEIGGNSSLFGDGKLMQRKSSVR